MELAEIRRRVYGSYEDLLKTGSQPDVFAIDFLDSGRGIFLSTPIDDEKFQGASYLMGNIEKRLRLDDVWGILANTDNGVELFEHYTGRNFRPIVVARNNLVVDMTALRNNLDKLEGMPPEQLVEENLSRFSRLLEDFKSLSPDDYLEAYLTSFADLPVHF